MARAGLAVWLGESAETAALSVTPHPFGSPGGPGLWRHKGLQLPPYIQNVAHGILDGGGAKDQSEAIQIAIGRIQDWAGGGGKVSAEVKAAAGKAVAEWEALRAGAGGGGSKVKEGLAAWLSEAPASNAAANAAQPGDSDYGAASSTHPRGGVGSGQGGKFVKAGDHGSAVTAVQSKLGIEHSGTFDAGTVSSVMAFQRRHGLVVDGVVGRQTELALTGQYGKARSVGPGPLAGAGGSSRGSSGRRVLPSGPQSPRGRGGAVVAQLVEGRVVPWLGQLSEDEVFDPALHPRDPLGRFADKLNGLGHGQAVRLPDGTRVIRDRDETLRVVRSGRIVRGFTTSDVAAQDALDRSARSRHPQSVGGTTSLAGYRGAYAYPVVSDRDVPGRAAHLRGELEAARTSSDEYVRRGALSIARRLHAVEYPPGRGVNPGPVVIPETPEAARGDVPIAPPAALARWAGEHTVTAPILGRDATLHLRALGPVPANGSPPERLTTRDPIALVRTRTGNTTHQQFATFDRVATLRHPPYGGSRVTVNGEEYVLRRATVARNRPATVLGLHSDVGPRSVLRSRPPVIARPEPAPPVAAPVLTGALAHLSVGNVRARTILGTNIVAAERHGALTYVRGEDGRTWSINGDAVARGAVNPATVQVRTQTGTAYTAPSMEQLLGGPAGAVSDLLPSRFQKHPAAPVGAVRHGASRSGPSRAIPPASTVAASAAPRVTSGTAEQRRRLQGIVDDLHGFSHGGLTTKITSASASEFRGVVLDVNGRQVGSFGRTVRWQSDSIYHSIFSIRNEDRATGYGTAVINKMFESYRAHGFKYVDVSAGLDVGGYQWAKMGFGFQGNAGTATKSLLTENDHKLSEMVRSRQAPQALVDEFKRQMEDGQITSPSQIAAWGRRSTWTVSSGGKDHVMWLGKAFLLGSGWSGRKKLVS